MRFENKHALNASWGSITPSAGRVEVLGVNSIKHRHPVLGRMNFSSPYVQLPHRLSVREKLVVYARLYGVSQAASRVALAKELLN